MKKRVAQERIFAASKKINKFRLLRTKKKTKTVWQHMHALLF